MAGYVLRRLIATIPVLFVVSLLVFGLMRLSPGDPARLIAGMEAEEWQVDAIRESLGLNRPLPIQLGI